ncbi:MAG: hypothetical protein U0821_18175 [Chloroflexota bacterium]
MWRSAYGLPISTASSEAGTAYDTGVHGLLSWDREAAAQFERAAELDPSLAVAHAARAACHFMAEEGVEAKAAMERAARTTSQGTPYEVSHVNALALWMSGDAVAAERAMREHLAEYPRDIVILQRLFFIYFWQGRSADLLGTTQPALSVLPSDGFIQGLHAFSLHETGSIDESLRYGHAALDLNPSDAWAVHAVAHAYYECGDASNGAAFLPTAVAHCPQLGYFRTHLFWHLALFELAAGREKRVWDLYRHAIRGTRSTYRAELDDAIGLLWRLDLTGQDTAGRWGEIAEIARERIQRPNLVYHELMLAMALAAANDDAGLSVQRDRMLARAASAPVMRDVVLPLRDGLLAFRRGDYQRTVDLLEPIRGRIAEVGGSHAQREVFHDTLLESYLHTGNGLAAQRLLLDRLEHRPSAGRAWCRLARAQTETDPDAATVSAARAIAALETTADAACRDLATAREITSSNVV